MKSLCISGGVYVYHIDLTATSAGAPSTSRLNEAGFVGFKYQRILLGHSLASLSDDVFFGKLDSKIKSTKELLLARLFGQERYPLFVLVVELDSKISEYDFRRLEQFQSRLERSNGNRSWLLILVSRSSNDSSEQLRRNSFATMRRRKPNDNVFATHSHVTQKPDSRRISLDGGIRTVSYVSGNSDSVQENVNNLISTFIDGCDREAAVRELRVASWPIWASGLFILAPAFVAIIGKLTEKWFDFCTKGNQDASKPPEGTVIAPTSIFANWNWFSFIFGIAICFIFAIVFKSICFLWSYTTRSKRNSFLADF